MKVKHSQEWNNKISEGVKRTWHRRVFAEKVCENCKNNFIPTGHKHKFCGSESLKTGCSWKMSIQAKNKANKKFRKFLIENQNFTCEHCGLKRDNDYSFFDIDHKKPLKRGKNNLTRNCIYRQKDMENLQVLCPNCHRIKTIKNGDNSR